MMQHGQNALMNYNNASHTDETDPNFNLWGLLQLNAIYSCPHLVYITLIHFKTRHIFTESSAPYHLLPVLIKNWFTLAESFLMLIVVPVNQEDLKKRSGSHTGGCMTSFRDNFVPYT